MKVSILMSVYNKETPDFLKTALESIGIDQSVIPDEIVVVKDGDIGEELEGVLFDFKTRFSGQVKIIGYSKNMGLGYALNFGLEHCTNNLVLRMDSDDIAVFKRVELQKQAFLENQNLDICGMQIEEFDNFGNKFKRIVPLTKEKIILYSRFRNPFNHVTVAFKKDKIQKLGSYEDMPFFEDYFLWIKCIKSDFNFKNLNVIGVKVRAGNEMINRRNGIKYAKHEVHFYTNCFRKGYISFADFLKILVLRLPIRLLGPNMNFIYKKILRS